MAALSEPPADASVFAHPQTGDYDCETAALLRACLCPLFDRATSWKTLADRLASRGYGLAIRDSRLVITDRSTDHRVCTARYLGTSLRDLSARLGRPIILARRDQDAAGEFLI